MKWLTAIVLLGCGEDVAVLPDAAPVIDADNSIAPSTAGYWPCFAWNDVSTTVEKCDPKCANESLLGRLVWGEKNTCEYKPGVFCPPVFMTGQTGRGGVGCCVYRAKPEQVDFYACQ